MSTSTRRFDTEGLSRLIEQRLAETHRHDQASAFLKLGALRALLDALARFATPQRDVPMAEIGRLLRERHPKKRWLDPHQAIVEGASLSRVFLTHVDADHQALVFDFDALVDQIGELSVALVTSESAPNTELGRRFCTLWSDERDEPLPAPQPTPVTGSLAALKNVAELGPLDEPYQRLDFSGSRLRPTDFLRK